MTFGCGGLAVFFGGGFERVKRHDDHGQLLAHRVGVEPCALKHIGFFIHLYAALKQVIQSLAVGVVNIGKVCR
jgi:hypothetical protein